MKPKVSIEIKLSISTHFYARSCIGMLLFFVHSGPDQNLRNPTSPRLPPLNFVSPIKTSDGEDEDFQPFSGSRKTKKKRKKIEPPETVRLDLEGSENDDDAATV